VSENAAEVRALVQEALKDLRAAEYFKGLLDHVCQRFPSGLEENKALDKARDLAAIWLEEFSELKPEQRGDDLALLLIPVARESVHKQLGSRDDPGADAIADTATLEFLAAWPVNCQRHDASGTKLLRDIAVKRSIDVIRSRTTIKEQMNRGSPDAVMAEAERVKSAEASMDPLEDPETQEWLLAILEECLRALPSPLPEWFDRYYKREASWKMIAEEADLKPATVRKRVDIARQTLRECIDRKTQDIPD